MEQIPSVLIIGGTTYDHIVYLDQLPAANPTTIHQCGFQETTEVQVQLKLLLYIVYKYPFI
jgi:hypothetical protein